MSAENDLGSVLTDAPAPPPASGVPSWVWWALGGAVVLGGSYVAFRVTKAAALTAYQAAPFLGPLVAPEFTPLWNALGQHQVGQPVQAGQIAQIAGLLGMQQQPITGPATVPLRRIGG